MSAPAARLRALGRSLTVRALVALASLFVLDLLLHERFASVDAALARAVLGAVGLEVSGPGPALAVGAGPRFDVYAVVTGSCSSAAGALAIVAIAFVLLPGRPWRRVAGALLGAAAFVALNLARICSIILLGWWLSSTDRPYVLAALGALAAVCTALALSSRLGVLGRVAALLAAGLVAAVASSVASGDNAVASMGAYHALAGPALTFGSLAAALLVLWRLVAERRPRSAPAAPSGF